MTLSQLMQLMRYRLGLGAIVMACWIIWASLLLSVGWLLRALFDSLSGEAPADLGPWSLLALFIVVRLGGSFILSAWSFSQNIWYFVLQLLIQQNLLTRLLGGDNAPIPATLGGGLGAGEAVNRLRDDPEQIVDLINESYRLVGHVLFAGVAMTIMFNTEPLITLATCLPLAAIVTLIHTLNERLARYYTADRAATGRVSGFIGELFSAAQTIKVAAAEQRLINYFNELNRIRHKASLKASVFN
jgi:ATP-binding cassette subfamily B protein